MFSLIRGEFGNETSEVKDISRISDAKEYGELYKLAKKHDMAHIVGAALERRGLLGNDEVSAAFRKQQMLAVYRYETINYELEEIRELFEGEGIAFMPLKGSVIRKYYPQPWMRTSCDIDILVREEELERAIDALVNKLEYTNGGREYHDVSMYSPSKVHVELHFSLVDETSFPKANDVADRVWSNSAPIREGSFEYVMTDSFFEFYHVLHMAAHVRGGGCGVRPFLDMWILENKIDRDTADRERLLEEGGLLAFANSACELSNAWFSGAEYTDISRQLEDYVINGGVYGSVQNKVAAQKDNSDGRFKYILSRLFLPYSVLKTKYPVIEKHKWLTPFMQVRRWFSRIFGGRMKNSMQEIKAEKSVSREDIEKTAELFSSMGID